MHREFEAPEELQNAVKCFWYDRSDFGAAQTSFEVQPDGYAEIIFHFGSGCSIASKGKIQPLPSPFMMGLLNQPALFYTQGRFEIIAIRCYPWAVFDLLGSPPGKSDVHLFEHPISQLQATLSALIRADKTDEAIEQVKKYFLDTQTQIVTDSMLGKAGAAMRESNGTMQVNRIAASAHATVRTLERKFKQSSGHSVKDVSALIRFEQVRNKLWLYPDTKLAGLAHDAGYTDQAHMSREFKRYSGTTPAAFARKAKERKQIINSNFVAFVQA